MKLLYILPLLMLLNACVQKPKDHPQPFVDEQGLELIILNEGAWNQNNASLTIYSEAGSVRQQVIETLNDEKIGDVANDMKLYGAKLYIVVNESSNILVLDTTNYHIIKRIALFNGGTPRSPRNIIFYEGKGYITAFDGHVLRLDTVSLTIDKSVKVGRNPEGLTIQNNKLYVSNSGGLDYPNYDNTVSVIDLTTFQELKKITVGVNPGGLAADSEGEVYVVARGNHGDVKPQLVRIDAATDMVMDTISDEVFSIKIKEDQAYVSYNNAAFNDPQIRKFDPITETIAATAFTNLSALTGFYGFDIIENGVVCFDAKNFSTKGDAYWYDQSGQLITKINCGFIPSAAIYKE